VVVKTVAVCNQKGGVGKTTITLGLASAGAAKGVRVLVIDLDPQANATGALLPEFDGSSGYTSNDVLGGARGCAAEAITESTPWGVGVIAASLSLAARDLDTALGSEQKLRSALDSADLQADWDLCLVDCPPSVGRLVSAALVAADEALIVTEPSLMASQGVAMVQNTIATVREHYNPTLTLAGVAVNRVGRFKEAIYRLEELTGALGPVVWEPVMPQRAALVEAAGLGIPIHQHRPRQPEILHVLDTWLDRLLARGAKRIERGRGVKAQQATIRGAAA
jgi:chromosome partitioning protein